LTAKGDESLLSNSHILVVDDNSGIRQLLYEFLTQEGFYVKVASDGLKGFTTCYGGKT